MRKNVHRENFDANTFKWEADNVDQFLQIVNTDHLKFVIWRKHSDKSLCVYQINLKIKLYRNTCGVQRKKKSPTEKNISWSKIA